MVACDSIVLDELATKFGSASLLTCPNDAGDSNEKQPQRKPINLRLMDIHTYPRPAIKPRTYQSELAQAAIQENVIIYLGTGLGKTFITVLVINSPFIASQLHDGRKVVFLAPTQDLVQQQAEYISKKVPYKVRVYCGRSCQTGKHIDKWKDEEWEAQLSEIDILCMTPQIFTNAIVPSYIKWTNFSAIFFDEVHHAYSMKRGDSGHPYSKALEHYQNFYSDPSRSPKPRITGLTASLINNMPKDFTRINKGVQDLEEKISGRCITTSDGIDTKPLIVVHTFTECNLNTNNDKIIEILEKYASAMASTLGILDKKRIFMLEHGMSPTNDSDRSFLAFHERLNLMASGISLKPKSFHKILRQLSKIYQSSGLWTLANISHALMVALDKNSSNRCLSELAKPLYRAFSLMLKEFLVSINEFVGAEWKEVLLEYAQPKARALLDIILQEHSRVQSGQSENETFSCIVFVQSRAEVFALHNWLKHVSKRLPMYSFIKADYAIGMSATLASKWACITKRKSTEQSAMLDAFRRNDVNVVVTTSVLEEGIDLPVCSTVIRFDPVKTFRVYVQSRGRARQMHSSFISLSTISERQKTSDDLSAYDKMQNYLQALLNSKDIALDYKYRPKLAKGRQRATDESLYEDETFIAPGIYIDSCTASVLLNIYCSRLCLRYPYSGGIKYRRIQPTPDTFQNLITMPFGSPIKQEIAGNEKATLDLANKSATIKVLEALYELGELDEKGRPIRMTEERVDTILDGYHLKPNFTPLKEDEKGRVESEDSEKVFHVYPWKLFDLDAPISRGLAVQKYKLFRVQFEPSGEQVRHDSRRYFVDNKFGIIVNASRDSDLWPKKLYSHYGEFNVNYELVTDNYPLDTHSAHSDYMEYTLRIARYIWSIGRIETHEFKYHCAFYFVPLRSDGQVDLSKVKGSFRLRPVPQFLPNSSIRPGNIIKLIREVTRREDQSKLFMVRAIRSDMNARSLVPGDRLRRTFAQYAQDHYNIRIQNFDQRVCELAPISRQVAEYAKGKKIKPLRETNTILFLEQFVQILEEDASFVFQSYNLVPIVYRIYLSALCSQLDEKFRLETNDRRRDIVLPQNARETDEKINDHDDNDQIGQNMDVQEEEEAPVGIQERCPIQADLFDSNDEDEDEDGSDCSHDDTSVELVDSSEEEGDDSDARLDEDNSDDWKRFQEKYPQMKNFTIKHQNSNHSQKYLNTDPRFYHAFGQLESRTAGSLQQILLGLQRIRDGIFGDVMFTGDEYTLRREGPTNNLNVVPPIRFDQVEPIKPGHSREFGVLEALTQRRATEDFNLETLENVGDAFLKYTISVVLFKVLKGRNEGVMTAARMRLLGNKHFFHLSCRKKLGTYTIANKFSSKLVASALGTYQCVENKLKPKDLADTFESLIGAYLVYCGEYEAILALHWLGLPLISDQLFDQFHEKAVVYLPAPSALDKDCDSKTIELFNQNKKRVALFQEILGYRFKDESFLIQAFTHASAPVTCTESYERLEFLGDAILDYLITTTLYKSGYSDPGQLTQSRSALVNNISFSKLAIKYRYDIFLQHTDQDIMNVLTTINDRCQEGDDMEFLDDLEFDSITKLLGDIFEAVAGAIYLDSGCSLDSVWRIYYPMMKAVIDEEVKNPTKNIVMKLYEKYPGRVSFEYSLAKENGPDLDIHQMATCTIKDAGKYTGFGKSRRAAKMRAAENAIKTAPSLPPLVKKNPKRHFNRPTQHDHRGGGGQRMQYNQRGPSRSHNQYHQTPSYRGRNFH